MIPTMKDYPIPRALSHACTDTFHAYLGVSMRSQEYLNFVLMCSYGLHSRALPTETAGKLHVLLAGKGRGWTVNARRSMVRAVDG